MNDCKKDSNMDRCTCSYSCNKNGICCDCLNSHWIRGEVPACFFPDDVEKTYDRRIEKFIEIYQKRGRWW